MLSRRRWRSKREGAAKVPIKLLTVGTSALGLAVLTILLLFAILALGYHGEREFVSPVKGLPPPAQVVAEALGLTGTPYDPLMGAYGNLGASAGFIVCSDVPNIAYGRAGYSLQSMLRAHFAENPAAYDTRAGNRPGNPYFHRRARNLYAYFQAKGRLVSADTLPRVGDLAFYRRANQERVAHVALVTRVAAAEYWVMESAPETLWAQEVPGMAVVNRAWVLLGFGRMYQDANGPL